jgi:hypothetical protein
VPNPSSRGDHVTVARQADAATWLLVLAGVATGSLVAVGLLQFSLGGDVGSLARNLTVGLFLALFSAGVAREWRDG